MKRLNLRSPKPYESLWKGEQNPKIRFYLITEGPSEESYFEGIKNNKVELEINNDIYIEVIPKAEGSENLSHPRQLVIAALECMGRIDEDGKLIPKAEWSKRCKWDYDEEHDKVCVVFDRDYRRLEETLEEIYEMCRINNIFIGISNPNFELWLLMHFPNITQYKYDKLF